MTSPTPAQLRKSLIALGFEVYRAQGSRITIADRVRDNLIMDSGVSVVTGQRLAVRIVHKAQASEFPAETEEQLFERARRLGEPALSRGYAEIETSVIPVPDPGDPSTTLDTWYEVAFEKSLSDANQLPDELRFAVASVKSSG